MKRYETLKNFATFERTKMLAMTICEKMDHSAARGCHLCSEKLNRKKLKKLKSKKLLPLHKETIQVLLI